MIYIWRSKQAKYLYLIGKVCIKTINQNKLSSLSESESSSSTESSFSSSLGSISSSTKLSMFLNTSSFRRVCSRYDSDVAGSSATIYSTAGCRALVRLNDVLLPQT